MLSPVKFESTAGAAYSNLIKLLCNYEDIDKIRYARKLNKKKGIKIIKSDIDIGEKENTFINFFSRKKPKNEKVNASITVNSIKSTISIENINKFSILIIFLEYLNILEMFNFIYLI